MKCLPANDPIGVGRRKRVAQRAIGEGAQCACGESRPEALTRKGEHVECAACGRTGRHQSPIDQHHVAGIANSPLTMPAPVNDHRAELTPAQQDWPGTTRDNPDRSPLVAGAAAIRGAADYLVYLIRHGVLWVADMLELLDRVLVAKLGAGWWTTTEVAHYAPQQ